MTQLDKYDKMFEEQPRYRKKSKKTVKKSRHKHIYEDFIITSFEGKSFIKAKRCTVCGKEKLGRTISKKIICEETGMIFHTLILREEVEELYPNLDIVMREKLF